MKRKAEKQNVIEWENTSLEASRGSHGKLWDKVYKAVSSPSRKRVEVNVGKIGRLSKEGEHVIVPGKVLGIGTIGHKVSITALEYSEKAREELAKNGCAIIGIKDAVKGLDGKKTMVRFIR